MDQETNRALAKLRKLLPFGRPPKNSGLPTLKDIAKLMECDHSTLSRFRQKRFSPNRDLFIRLCEYYEIDPTTGEPIMDEGNEGSGSKRHRVHVRKEPQMLQPAVFAEDIPDEFEISSAEARLIYARRRTDPYRGFDVSLAEITNMRAQIPAGDLRMKANCDTLVSLLSAYVAELQTREKKQA